MTDIAQNVQTIPYNFNELYVDVQDSFKQQGYDTNEGSDVSQLVTAMAYMVSMLNANTSVNVNETILTEAKKRDNVYADARALCYEPRHITSYRYILTIELQPGSHVIPKYTQFNIGGKTYYYLGSQLEYPNLEEARNISIEVTEGEIKSYRDDPALTVVTTDVTGPTGEVVPQYWVDIPFVDVEENGIECYVTYYDEYGRYIQQEPWSRSQYYIIDDDVNFDKEYVREDDITYRTPRLYFKYAGTGKGLRQGSTVELRIIVSSGEDGVIEDITDTQQVKFNLNGAKCVEITLSSTGEPEESIDSVKENAPKFYNSANRCVTESDYESFCDRQTSVDKSSVWGGEEEYPKAPGHIWFSFAPTDYERNFTYSSAEDAYYYTYLLDSADGVTWNYTVTNTSDEYIAQKKTQEDFYNKRYIEDTEIRSNSYNDSGQLVDPGIWDVVDKYKVPTLDFHNRNPFYVYFDYDISILKYRISDTKESVHESIFKKVDNFFTGKDDTVRMEDFDVEYYNSSLEKRIDEILGDDSGYHADLKTCILLNQKTVSAENPQKENRDIIIPLAVPYENYFDSNGFLIVDVLPSIDTENFINYGDDSISGSIYTDWSEIAEDISNGIDQESEPVLNAPIMNRFIGKYTLTEEDAQTDYDEGEIVIKFEGIAIQPDDLTVLDKPGSELTFDNTVVKVNDTVIPYSETAGWYTNWLDDKNVHLIGVDFAADDKLTVEQAQKVGEFYIFNDFKHYCLVHLYVNAYGYLEDGSDNDDVTTPRSYLYTNDFNYLHTPDNFYLTTKGYVTTDSDPSIDDSDIITNISINNYIYSPLSMELFRQSRFLDLNYETDNFAVIGNVMPRLRSVNFEKRV